MKQEVKQQIKNSNNNGICATNIPPEFRVVVSRCINCKDGAKYRDGFEIPSTEERPKCEVCGHRDLQFYVGDKRKRKGGLTSYRMADEKAKKPAAPKSTAKKTVAKDDKKKSPRGYSDEVIKKVVDMGKQGKSVKDIEKSMGASGPKSKAIIRYLKKAGVKDIKRK